MSSGIYVTISLDPFLQSFLRGYFRNENIVFSFPKESRKNYLPGVLKLCVDYPPENFNPKHYGDREFKIELPAWGDKDPNSQNYISERANAELEKAILDFYYPIVYSEFQKARAVFLKGPSAVNLFMDKYNIPEEFRDRLLRDYTRFCNYLSGRKFLEKKQKNIKENICYSV